MDYRTLPSTHSRYFPTHVSSTIAGIFAHVHGVKYGACTLAFHADGICARATWLVMWPEPPHRPPHTTTQRTHTQTLSHAMDVDGYGTRTRRPQIEVACWCGVPGLACGIIVRENVRALVAAEWHVRCGWWWWCWRVAVFWGPTPRREWFGFNNWQTRRRPAQMSHNKVSRPVREVHAHTHNTPHTIGVYLLRRAHMPCEKLLRIIVRTGGCRNIAIWCPPPIADKMRTLFVARRSHHPHSASRRATIWYTSTPPSRGKFRQIPIYMMNTYFGQQTQPHNHFRNHKQGAFSSAEINTHAHIYFQKCY